MLDAGREEGGRREASRRREEEDEEMKTEEEEAEEAGCEVEVKQEEEEDAEVNVKATDDQPAAPTPSPLQATPPPSFRFILPKLSPDSIPSSAVFRLPSFPSSTAVTTDATDRVYPSFVLPPSPPLTPAPSSIVADAATSFPFGGEGGGGGAGEGVKREEETE